LPLHASPSTLQFMPPAGGSAWQTAPLQIPEQHWAPVVQPASTWAQAWVAQVPFSQRLLQQSTPVVHGAPSPRQKVLAVHTKFTHWPPQHGSVVEHGCPAA
jgi:hypothetical protein